ncbi:MAG: Gfo/Idh/MocA family oxidoreductase, partial [Nitrososphaeria archaeon]|nr:Gfo/Idh/MocA family oxidoreductase [Nitrososphaeria archaeon]
RERLEDVVKVYEVREVYTDYREMLEKADIDAVVITTPHKYHFPMALDAIREEKHLIVEKPLGINSQEARKIAEEA